MARTVDPKAEMTAIFSVLDGKHDSLRLQFLAKLKETHFGYGPTDEIFQAIQKNLRKQHGASLTIPTSRALRHSPGLSDEAKNILKSPKKPLNSKDDLEQLYEALELRRKLRSVHGGVQELLKDLSKETDKIKITEVEKKIISLHDEFIDPNRSNEIVDLDSDEGEQLFESIWEQEDLITTGFKNFDSKAGGYTKGDMVMLAANSGGGKSVMAQTIDLHCYKNQHLRTALVTIELTKKQALMRILSNETGIDHDKIRQRTCSKSEKKTLKKAYKKLKRHGRKHGGCFKIFHPEGGVTATELLLMLKPYNLDVIFIDNINDLEHVDGDSDWARLGNSAKVIKAGAIALNALIYCCTHVTEDNRIAYSKMLKEKADGIWMWTFGDDEKASNTVQVHQPKARHFEAFSFFLTPEFRTQCFLDSAGPPEMGDKEDKELMKAMSEVPG